MPSNLIVIVVVQSIVLIAVLVFQWRAGRRISINWPLATLTGIVFGTLMDLVLGAYGIFAYRLHGLAEAPIKPHDLPVAVLLFNALASYGIASVTVSTIASRVVSKEPSVLGFRIGIVLFTVCGFLGVISLPTASISSMFAWGATIISAGELVLCLNGTQGPFLALLTTRDWKPLLNLWGLCLFVGVTYEITNLFFPFWVWLPSVALNQGILTVIIAFFGYVALLHPMAVLYVLIADKSRRPTS